jgi:hypothetical protein
MISPTPFAYHARAGQVIGSDHAGRAANCQDAFALAEAPTYVAGFVCDGCGEGQRSEVGAALAAQFLASRAAEHLTAGTAIESIPSLLYGQLVGYLQALMAASNPAEPVQFAKDHLLFTVLGLLVTPSQALLLAAGDGLLVMDAQVLVRDENNAPTYIGYHLFAPSSLALTQPLPTAFDTYTLPPAWQRLAIASDGYRPDLVSHLWNHTHRRGLQRKLNVLAGQERQFRDDATAIVVERQKE